MTGRAYAFIDLYKQLEDELENRLPARDKGHVSVVMNYSNTEAGQKYRDRLNLCREVRNLLSHNADLGGEAPVEPSQALLDTLSEVLAAVRAEPSAMTRATPRERLLTARLSDRAVPLMRRMGEVGFSHVPVLRGAAVSGVFSVSTVFAAGLQGRRFSLTAQTQVGDFAALLAVDRHMTERFLFAPADALLCDVKTLFEPDREKRLPRVAAVFLTDDGTRDGALEGLLTPWDIIKSDAGGLSGVGR